LTVRKAAGVIDKDKAIRMLECTFFNKAVKGHVMPSFAAKVAGA
jgi:hypothetical protein